MTLLIKPQNVSSAMTTDAELAAEVATLQSEIDNKQDKGDYVTALTGMVVNTTFKQLLELLL